MENIKPIVLTLVSLATIVGIAHGSSPTCPDSRENWITTRYTAKGNVSVLRFYVHDVISTENPTNVDVAKASTTSSSPTSFGLVQVMDDPVTVGPELGSKIIGRAQGIYIFASLEEIRLHMTFTIIFTEGEYKASSLSYSGSNPYQDLTQSRNISIVGGTGVFAFARGVTFVNTLWSNSSGDATFVYNSVVLHEGQAAEDLMSYV